MLFGLKAAPATFQILMNSIHRDSIGTRIFVYMDDILVMGETLQEHQDKLREVFELLRKHNVKLESDKCEFLKQDIQYLGYVITSDQTQVKSKQ